MRTSLRENQRRWIWLRIPGLAGLAIVGLVVLIIAVACIVYPPEYVYRVLVWQQTDVFDWEKFPSHPLHASATPWRLPSTPDRRVAQVLAEITGIPDWEQVLQETDTQSFIVIQDGKVLYEKYANGTRRDSIVTSFSVAKSFTSALVGAAIEEGLIADVDDPITKYLPELAARDRRFTRITIRHLLLMASGLEFREFRPLLFNSDNPLTAYHPDQRKLALTNTRIEGPPGRVFSYNKYHPQLLGMILERVTGMAVTEYLQKKIWDPLGMEYDGSWSTDSRTGDFEKMETGVNARAIDFAKFGLLFLNGGLRQNQRVLSPSWVEESTKPDWSLSYTQFPGGLYYKYMWWGIGSQSHPDDYDFLAAGDKGQYIFVSPVKKLVIVRNGLTEGLPKDQWIQIFYEFVNRF